MLDPRVYRAALLPALLALIVAAFSIEQPPRPLTAALSPDSFSGPRAYAVLHDLATTFPDRSPGGRGDGGLARRVRAVFSRSGLRVRVRTFSGRTARGRKRLRTVTGTRVGLSSRQLVVVAHRDALSRPATAELSGTAALLGLARVFQGRQLRKSLVLISTSGGSGGAAGAAEAARHLSGPVDAVFVLGDLAGRRVRRPMVVPWSNALGVAPLQLRRTVEGAIAQETGLRPGIPRPAAQFAHLAFPLTVGEQGEFAAAGFPAVLVSVSGEPGPGAATAVGGARLGAMGRAVLRSVTALDAPNTAQHVPRPELLVARKVVPAWAIRLLIGALILPVLLAAIDGFARVRRRQHPVMMWIAWVLSGAAPFALAIAFSYLLVLVGLLPTPPPSAAPRGAVELDVARFAALACIALVGVVGWLTVRPALLRLAGVRGDPGSPGAAAGLCLVMVALVVAVWAVNPFAAAILVAPLHACMLMTAPEVRTRRAAALAVVLLSLVPLALVALYYALALGLGPAQVAWMALLVVLGGHVGPASTLAWCLLLGCLASVLAIVRAQGLAPPPALADVPIRGPVTYAGPGSLGGTESALRR